MRHPIKAAVIAALVSVPAYATVFTFDGAGGLANDYAVGGVSFQPAVVDFAYDAFGDPIPGSQTWRVDATAPAITVENPEDFGRGAAPSPTGALNALFQPVLILLPGTSLLKEFGVVLDNDPFGTSGASIEFYSRDNTLLGSLATDQTVAGFSASLTAELAGVDHIVLPAGAFYDNVTVAAVPEPGEFASVAAFLSVVGAGVRVWRQRRRTSAVAN